jgi:hypothetical protein
LPETERSRPSVPSMALIEWTLESRGRKTIVHLLQSGFLGNADWENEWFDSTGYGWGFILLSLQVALERHPGTARQVAHLVSPGKLVREEYFTRTDAPEVLLVSVEAKKR